MGSILSDSCYWTIIICSLPKSYRLALQTITAAKQANAISGALSSSKMKLNDLMNSFIEEAQHHFINFECFKGGDCTLTVHGRKGRPGHSHKGEKTKSSITCENCGKYGHAKLNCYSKGGGQEGLWLKQKKFNKQMEKELESTAVKKGKDEELTNADRWTLKAVVGIGDVCIELTNGCKQTPALLKDTVYAPRMAFTLISVGHLDKADSSVTFLKGMCTIQNPEECIMHTILMANGYIILPTQVKGPL